MYSGSRCLALPSSEAEPMQSQFSGGISVVLSDHGVKVGEAIMSARLGDN